MSFERAGGNAARHAVMVALSLLALLPLYFMLVNAFKTEVGYATSPLGLPHPLTWENFARVFAQSSMARWIVNSAVLTVSSVSLAMLVSTTAAYAFARIQFPGVDVLFRAVSALMAAHTGVRGPAGDTA